MYKVMVSAGEASGDAHAAHALDALKATGFQFESFGMGAGQLDTAGTELIVDCRDLAVIGFVDVIKNYHKFLKRLKTLRKTMAQRMPDILVLVDFPDFNLKLAETAVDLGIPVLFYVSPQIWAWRAGRIHRIGKLVSHMAVLFPFEVPYYEKQNIPVTYVGNPVVADAQCPLDRDQAAESLGLEKAGLIVGLLPGSRPGELTRILPSMLEAASILEKNFAARTNLQFVLPKAETIDREFLDGFLQNTNVKPVVTSGNSCAVMRACDLVICASGTATLETALIGTPMILVYKVSWLNYQIMSRLIQIPDIGLVNIVAGKRIVPELLQEQANGLTIAETSIELLSNTDSMDQMREELTAVKEKMGDAGASGRVAALIQQLILER